MTSSGLSVGVPDAGDDFDVAEFFLFSLGKGKVLKGNLIPSHVKNGRPRLCFSSHFSRNMNSLVVTVSMCVMYFSINVKKMTFKGE